MGLFKALHDAFFHTVSTKERNHFSKFRSMLISREGYAERHVDLLAFQFVAFLDCFEDPFDAVVVQFIQAMEAFDEGFHDKGHCFFFEDGNGFFITINEEKMSKSLGNFFTVLDILKEYEPEVLRYFILQTHYRSPLDFSDARLKEASRSLERLRTAAQNLTELKGVISVGPDEDSLALREKVSGFVESFLEAMRDDFNTSLAISYLFALGKEINILHQSVMTGGQKPDGKLVDMMDKAWKEMTSIIGILEEDPGAKTEAVKDADEDAAAIESLIAERQEARKAKDFKKADAIRDELAQKGILLEDTPQGVRWKRQ